MNCTFDMYKKCVNIMIQLSQLNGKKHYYDDKIIEISSELGEYVATDNIYIKASSFLGDAILQNKEKSKNLITRYHTADVDDWINVNIMLCMIVPSAPELKTLSSAW